jgi:hypothetical protein
MARRNTRIEAWFDTLAYSNRLLTNSMKQSRPTSWEANRFSASQEIPSNLWSPEVYHRIHMTLPPAPVLSQLNPVHASVQLLEDQF